MDLEIFAKMDAPGLRKYIEFLLWHYRVIDAFWFLYVAEHFDQPPAERILHLTFDGTHGMVTLIVEAIGRQSNVVLVGEDGAVLDALKPFGVKHIDMPLTSEKVWRAMHGKL